ncbi:MAG: hypothetical protein QW117_01750 [Candidatus Pacearchaeota archaeon]
MTICYSLNENIIFEYQNEVYYGKDFFVNLTLINFSDVYDVKIDIFSLNGSRLSKIFNNGNWVSTYYYVNNAINTSISNFSNFNLNITEPYNGTAIINITLRKSSTSSTYKFGSYFLNIIYINNSLEEENKTEKEKEIEEDTENLDNEEKIFISLDYEKEIENGKEFEVKVKAYNLKEEYYDIKIYITKKNTENIISETYNDEKWKSSNYYVKNVFYTKGNISEIFKVRIDSDYSDFYGDAEIKAKIRRSNSSTYIYFYKNEIKILKKEISESNLQKEKIKEKNITSNISLNIKNASYLEENEDIIRLNSKKENLKTKENKLYLSKNEYIKEYLIYFFTLFCIFVIIYIIRQK